MQEQNKAWLYTKAVFKWILYATIIMWIIMWWVSLFFYVCHNFKSEYVVVWSFFFLLIIICIAYQLDEADNILNPKENWDDKEH